jgi:hypothetical protein
MYFLWSHHLPPNKSGNYQDIVTLIDSHIVLTYIWLLTSCHIWHIAILMTVASQSPIFSESCFGNDNKFLSPNPWVVLFFIYPTFYSLKILFTQPFSLRCPPPPPAINNDRSLNKASKGSGLLFFWYRRSWSLFLDLTWQGKIRHFLKISAFEVELRRIKSAKVRMPIILELGNKTQIPAANF